MILILGNKGMLGHLLERYLTSKGHEVTGLNRSDVDFRNFKELERKIFEINPDYIINCAGILNTSNDINLYTDINILLPHYLKRFNMGKVIHISTNCVFKDIGPHSDHDIPDAQGLYGMSKAFGEINDNNHLTIRCSITGPEIKISGTGLMHQFLTDEDFTSGYGSTMWNGVTTLELAKFIESSMEQKTGIVNYYTRSAETKHDVVCTINDVFNLGKDISIIYNDKAHHSLLTGDNGTRNLTAQFLELKEWMSDNRDLYGGVYNENIYS